MSNPLSLLSFKKNESVPELGFIPGGIHPAGGRAERQGDSMHERLLASKWARDADFFIVWFS